ncbi:MAG: Lrp/AsnC family transcriptional regulator [Candidatus Micrarchaeota archaeon]
MVKIKPAGLALDSRDRCLLLNLQKDCRQPLNALARKLKTSKEVVHYRLSRLVASGVVSRFIADWPPEAAGLCNYVIYFRLEGMPAKSFGEMRRFLAADSRVAWVGELSGRFDLVVKTYLPDAAELNSFLSSFASRFGKFVRERQVTIRISQTYCFAPRELFSEFSPPTARHSVAVKNAQLDAMDLKILNFIGGNARAPYSQIAASVAASPETVKKRLDSLRKRGVVRSLSCWLNVRKLGYSHFKVFLRLQYSTVEKLLGVAAWCEEHPKTNFIVTCIGPWDLEIDLVAKNNEEFHAALNELRAAFRDSIAEHSWVVINADWITKA